MIEQRHLGAQMTPCPEFLVPAMDQHIMHCSLHYYLPTTLGPRQRPIKIKAAEKEAGNVAAQSLRFLSQNKIMYKTHKLTLFTLKVSNENIQSILY